MKAFLRPITPAIATKIVAARHALAFKEGLPPANILQGTINNLASLLEPQRFTEELDIVDETGRPSGLKAQRWAIHLLGLPHRVVRVILLTPDNHVLLQLRGSRRSSVANKIDFSAGGHIEVGATRLETAFKELEEEIGLTYEDLLEGRLFPGTLTERVVVAKPAYWTLNFEWTYFYFGRMRDQALDRVFFNDGEASGTLSLDLSDLSELCIRPNVSLSFLLCLPVLKENLWLFLQE